jgi:FtsZ-interacting cell division protein YlmF
MARVWEKLKRWLLAEDGGQEETKRRGNAAAVGDRPDQIVVSRPRTLDEAHVCAGWLKDQRTVVVNLSVLEQHVARRALDFLGGVVYAIDGQMEEAGDLIYVMTPSVMVTNSQADARQDVQLAWPTQAGLR